MLDNQHPSAIDLSNLYVLEQNYRILQQKLEQAEATCRALERLHHQKDVLLHQSFQTVQNAQIALEQRAAELRQLSQGWQQAITASHPPDPGLPASDHQGGSCGSIARHISAQVETVQPRTAAQLKEQEQLLCSMYKGAGHPICIVEVTEEGTFHYEGWNQAMEQQMQCLSEAIVGKTPEDWWGEAQGALVRQNYQRCLASGTTLTYEECLTVQGTKIWWLTTLSPLRNDHDRIYRIVSTSIDICDRKQAEAALIESEAYHRRLFDQAAIGLALCRMDGQLVYVNAAFANIIGRRVEDIFSLTYWQITPEKYAAAEEQQLQKLHQTGYYGPYEKEYIHKDGYLIPVRLSGVVVERQGEQFIWSSVEDIRDRKTIEAALEQKARQEKLLNRITSQIRSSLDFDTILTTTVEAIRNFLQIDSCSFAWYRPHDEAPTWEIVKRCSTDDLPSLLGHYPANAFGCLAEQLLALDTVLIDDVNQIHDPATQQLMRSLDCCAILCIPMQVQSGLIGVISCRHRRARTWTDEEVNLLKSAMEQLAIALNQAELYTQSQTKAQELQCTLQELQRAQAQLVQSEKMSSLGQLVAGVAHEINNPVSFIYGNVAHASDYIQDLLRVIQLYQDYYPTPDSSLAAELAKLDLNFLRTDLTKLLGSMKMGADRIKQIVLSLRTFSRMDEAEYKAVNLHEGIDSTLMILANRLRAQYYRPAIQVIRNYGQLPLVECYAGQMNQVFMNILVNAIDALDERDQNRSLEETKQHPSCIWITTTVTKQNQVSIRIADNGVGMTEAVCQRLFDPFFTTKPVGQGTGMGLSISYQIVTERHNGTIEVKPGLGHGAEFIIHLPIQAKVSV